jgi:hypothetical protein
MFALSSDSMDAEDWLCTMERELHTAQCDDREKVLYGPHFLRRAAQSWWESYLATIPTPTLSPGRNSKTVSASTMFLQV